MSTYTKTFGVHDGGKKTLEGEEAGKAGVIRIFVQWSGKEKDKAIHKKKGPKATKRKAKEFRKQGREKRGGRTRCRLTRGAISRGLGKYEGAWGVVGGGAGKPTGGRDCGDGPGVVMRDTWDQAVQ